MNCARSLQSHDGKYFAVTSGDKGAQLDDARSHRLTRTIDAGSTVHGEFSPDSRRLVTARVDQTVHVWDVETGSEVVLLPRHPGGVCALAISPDGTRISPSRRLGNRLLCN